MAIIKRCDICKTPYDTYNEANSSKNTNGIMYVNIDKQNKYYGHDPIDCCPECMNKIKSYVDALRG